MAEWTRVVNTTISDYVRGEESNILRNRKLLAMLQQRGRISMNHSGTSIVKRVRFKRAPMIGYADGDTLTFSRRDRWRTAELDWRGYSSTDAMTKKEKLMNQGTQAIINIYADLGKSLMDDVNDQFGEEFYIDGYATGNTKKICGIESAMGTTGSAAAYGYVMVNQDTYANLKTDLGYYGGNWTQSGGNVTWPSNTGDAHYDFWTPTIVSYTNASFQAASDTWVNNCEEALRFGIIKAAKNRTKKGSLDYITLDDELYRLFLGVQNSRQTIFVNRNEGQGLVSLGFKDVFNYDGVEMTFEYGMPANVAYGFNVDQMELMSLQGQLFVVDGPDYDISTKAWRTSIDFFGNFWFNPRYQVKWMAGG